MLDLQRLHTLTEVAKTGSFSRAAESLLISQPTVWTHIHQLERELGIKLVERLGRRIHLTPAAEQLLGEVNGLLGAAQRLEQTAAELRGDHAGALRLGASTTPGLYLAPPLLAEVRRRRPQAAIQFRLTNSSHIPQLLLDNQIDVGLLGRPAEQPMLSARRFFTDEIILVGPAEAAARRKQPLKPEAAAELPVIFREPGSGTREQVESWYRSRGISPKVVMELDQPDLIKRMVAVRLGWAFVSRLSVADELRAGSLDEVRCAGLPLKRDLYVAHHRDKALPGAGRDLIECLDPVVARLTGKR